MIRRRAALADLSDLTDLSTLDPAGTTDPDAASSVPALAMLERVLATPRDGSTLPASPAVRPTRYRAPRPTGRRLALAGGVVAALALGGVLLPGLGDRAADAAWTAVPGQLDRQETLDAAQECRQTWRDTSIDPPPTEAQVAAMNPLVAEHRGDASLVVVGGEGWFAACLLDESGYVASLSPPDATAAVEDPAHDEVVAWSAFMSRLESGDAFLALVGRAGADVAAVALHPEGTFGDVDVVHATLRDGWFIAFWPVGSEDAERNPVRTPLTVTLRTGEVLRDVVLPWAGE